MTTESKIHDNLFIRSLLIKLISIGYQNFCTQGTCDGALLLESSPLPGRAQATAAWREYMMRRPKSTYLIHPRRNMFSQIMGHSAEQDKPLCSRTPDWQLPVVLRHLHLGAGDLDAKSLHLGRVYLSARPCYAELKMSNQIWLSIACV